MQAACINKRAINCNKQTFKLLKKCARATAIASISISLVACGNGEVNPTTVNSGSNQAKVSSKELPSSGAVLASMEKVANWQVPRIDSLQYLDFKRGESLEAGRWVQGVFYISLTEIAQRSANPFYKKWISFKGNELNWQLGRHYFFGDDQLIGQTYIWHYLNQEKNEQILAPTKKAFNALISESPNTSLEFYDDADENGIFSCQRRWCWADALFMAPPTWFALTQATGDQRYADYAHKEVRATVDYLFDPEYDLLYRDSRFKQEKDQFGNQLFWARGSGWVFAGLARMMEYIPKDDPNRKFYEDLFKKMAAKLKSLQKKDGSWAMSLLAEEKMPQPETSGTGFFTYGIAWGINNGLLSEREYMPSLTKGWAVLNSAVHPSGKLGWVQQIGDSPDGVSYDDSQVYGVGAFILAGSEIYDYQKGQSK
ncbi:glycoside hydrolase family 88 protein [Paraglaciecola aquimarina]|uniref:Glycoside hydrolase family 88 protein n=1 Tax=Paraglaciecola algarum TaxID=3050085 RepID=A0ABS9D7K7_9ALTE|nr:glycoside hydrolase family 88 protein [Paraglaciecola sp. G1-23]MCF2948861.1 glycoside hydrolase family 88 protein [Paraglaciecola sp. G1-23]